MVDGKKIVVVMPAYNAGDTLQRTYDEVMATGVVDRVIIVDDASTDRTASTAAGLANVRLHVHEKNRGYGANQKTCYKLALQERADIIVMVHPDYQYTPKLIPALAALISSGLYSCAIGSRILGGKALAGGMPLWKYIANRVLTFIENIITGAKLSEYHSGYRAFSRQALEAIPFEANSDDFVFDNQLLCQMLWAGHTIAEITCPTRYFPQASSIGFRRAFIYGFGCLLTALEYRLAKMRIIRPARYRPPASRAAAIP